MRDYKQMQEIQKLKEQAAADTSQHDGNRDESEKYTKRNPGFKGWLEYIVEYYKWPILLGTAVVIGLLVGAVQMSNNANPDLSTMYVGPFYLTPTEQDKLQAEIAALSGDKAGDYNGDGEFRFDFLDITLTHLTDADGVQFTMDDQNTAYTRFMTELRAGDTLLYFLEPHFYRQALADDILTPLSELGIDPSLSRDGYGIAIGDLDAYELNGFRRMPIETVVCLRRSPDKDAVSYGRTIENWNAHRDAFLSIVGYKTTTRVPDTQTPPDVTLFYAGAQPVYNSMRYDIETALSAMITDENGDNRRKCALHAITKSGSDALWKVNSKAIRTELITGDSFLMLLDEESFRYALEHDLLEALPKELQDASGAKEGYGILLSSLPIYNTDGFHELASLSYLCLRKAPEDGAEHYGRTQKDYDAAKKLFESLTKSKENT